MKIQEFTQSFFGAASKTPYGIYSNRNGQKAVNFGHKQLHEGHVEKLYRWAQKHQGKLSTADFNLLILGRPCACAPFFEICELAGLCKLYTVAGRTRIYGFTL